MSGLRLNLLNTRTITANNIYLNYDDNITNILDLFPQTNDFNQQLNLKRNVVDSYDKTQIDNSLSLKANQNTTYTKTQIDNSLSLKQDLLSVLSLPNQTSLLNGNY